MSSSCRVFVFQIVAVLLHFSLLSSLCWMAVEAFYMYLALVLVFKTYFTNFILKCSLVGWGTCLLPRLLVLTRLLTMLGGLTVCTDEFCILKVFTKAKQSVVIGCDFAIFSCDLNAFSHFSI